MSTRQDADAVVCTGCRGHGWKFRRSRRALVIGTLTRGQADAMRQSCLDCGGSGRAAEPV